MAAGVVAILMAACTEKAPQNTYTLSGTVEGLADGDTLLLTDANGVTVDTIIVKEGKFSYTGLADTVVRYALNVAKDDFNSLMFLSEPGIITMHVSARPYESTVGGTVANDALQQLMVSVLKSSSATGFQGQYRYLKTSEDDSTSVLFLDCSRSLQRHRAEPRR